LRVSILLLRTCQRLGAFSLLCPQGYPASFRVRCLSSIVDLFWLLFIMIRVEPMTLARFYITPSDLSKAWCLLLIVSSGIPRIIKIRCFWPRAFGSEVVFYAGLGWLSTLYLVFIGFGWGFFLSELGEDGNWFFLGGCDRLTRIIAS
jgi:hypothetical protein